MNSKRQYSLILFSFTLVIAYDHFLHTNIYLISIHNIYRENIGQDGKYTDLNFATFIAFSMPIAVINLIFTWIILGWIFLGHPKYHSKQHHSSTPTFDAVSKETDSQDILSGNSSSVHVARILRRKLNELGNITFHECVVIVLITIAVVLWLFRDPQVFPGWFSLFPVGYPKIGDSTVAVAILVIMFIIPKELSYFQGGKKTCFH